MTSGAEPAIFGCGRWYLAGLEQHLLGIFVRHVKELLQCLVLGRIELPQVECPSLTRENPAKQHDLDYIDKPDWLVYQGLDACLQSGHLFFFTP